MQDIELELRGECTETFDELKRRLDALAMGKEETRVMAMFFGEVEGQGVDIRCRVTNGVGEVVTKIGDYHAHDRREVSVDVTREQVVGFAKMFSAMGFSNAKVGTRKTWKYLIDGIDVSLVRGLSGLGYVEFEKLVAREEIERERPLLEALAERVGVVLWTTGEEYYVFCQRLTHDEDWRFTGSKEDVTRLESEIGFISKK